MKLVVDASVVVKWLVLEDDSDQAADLRRFSLMSVELMLSECANSLWKFVRLGRLEQAEAHSKLRYLTDLGMRLVLSTEVAHRALQIALEVDHPVYDCVYVAAAERERARLVTADARFLRKLANTPFAHLAVSLQDAAAN